jgi:hypothetical protein
VRLEVSRPATTLGTRLCDDWRAASLRAGWAFPRDWWVPEVEAVVEALIEGRNLAVPCALLGRARADAGVGLDEALTDLAALPGAQAAAHPLVRALAAGWAEVACEPATTGVCEDPLTGLATPAYLRTRLAEVYREAAWTRVRVASGHVLVVVAVDPAEGLPLVTTSRLLLVGAGLRDTFSGGETVAGAGPTHAVALGRRERSLAAKVAALSELLADRLRRVGSPPARVWIESLPPELTAAYQLLTDLAR